MLQELSLNRMEWLYQWNYARGTRTAQGSFALNVGCFGQSGVCRTEIIQYPAAFCIQSSFAPRRISPFVSTVGRDEEKIRAYIKNQEMADQQGTETALRSGSDP